MSDSFTPIRTVRRRRTPKVTERTLTVRMYDVGFGDCFLLSIPKADGNSLKILFDCGTIKLGPRDTPIKSVVQQVIKDVRDANNSPRIDVVVATHRHKDHIIGFDDPAWGEVEVGEVWMPWTEKPDDPGARKICDLHHRLAEQLERRLRQALASAPADPILSGKLEAGLDMALNALSNDDAMRTLYQGFAKNPTRHYFPQEGATTTWFTTPVLPGVTVHVLGPSRDPEMIGELNPPAGQSYLKMNETGGDTKIQHPIPLGADWSVSPAGYRSAYPNLDRELPEEDRKLVQDANLGLDEAVASALDQALNGTSLVLVFQIGRATLLFPGDAQWGTWRLAMESIEFRKLLAVTNFYKVGHHGSHNATPVEFVEKIMGKDVRAMISVYPTANWPMVPKGELLDKLRAKEGCKLARSDCPDDANQSGFTVTSDFAIEAKIPF